MLNRKAFTMRRSLTLLSCFRKSCQETVTPTSGCTFLHSRNSHNVAEARLSPEIIKQEFGNLLPNLVKELTEDPQYNRIPMTLKWYNDVLEYNCVGGKMNRGQTVLQAYLSLKNNKLTDEELKDTLLTGWGLELLQSFYLLMDDYIDQSETRRGKPCWYRTKNLGAKGLNDGFLIESGIYELFYSRLGKRPYYRDLVRLFKDMNSKSIIGEALDILMSTPIGQRPNLSLYTIENYEAICKFKSSYYTIYMPVKAAMILAGIKDKSAFDAIWNISLPLGIYFQAQDDFIDCYGDPKVTGKVGTDIKEGKCTWLVVQAMAMANESQKKTVQDHYGSVKDDDIQKIKALYEELQLPEVFNQQMEKNFALVRQEIEKLPTQVPKDIFESIVKKIVKRVK